MPQSADSSPNTDVAHEMERTGYSGCATLERWRLNDKNELFLYRAKTGNPVYVPLPDYVADALRNNDSLDGVMSGILRYSTIVQDVSVTDDRGVTLVSTDPDLVNQQTPHRDSLESLRRSSVFYQARQVFGKPQVLQTLLPLDRNGKRFLVVRVGVRSTFLRYAYVPWLRAAASTCRVTCPSPGSTTPRSVHTCSQRSPPSAPMPTPGDRQRQSA